MSPVFLHDEGSKCSLIINSACPCGDEETAHVETSWGSHYEHCLHIVVMIMFLHELDGDETRRNNLMEIATQYQNGT